MSRQIANRYELHERIGAGSMGSVYRATDRLTGQSVAIKQILWNFPVKTGQHDLLRLSITREFRTLATMRHPNIISVFDYGFYDGQPFFTMDYLAEARPLDAVKHELSVSQKIMMLVQLLQALAYIHQRGIVHHDLKPSNIMLTKDRLLKVLDFGLANIQDETTGDELVGTIAYMAPEVLNGNRADKAADLYAVGVIACELLLGRHPFKTETLAQLIAAILTGQPDLEGMEAWAVPIVRRLLDPDPVNRYANAHEVLQALRSGVDLDLPDESFEQRESYLRAARFVGREKELVVLRDALQTLQQDLGSAWLVTGESGVGKSRLIDELHTQALVNGVIVLRGQGVEGASLPYQLWREPVRRLALMSDPSPQQSSILKEIAPDLEILLARKVSDAPFLSASAQGERVVSAILNLFRAQSQPILLILEDLQWVSESLDPLKALLRMVKHLPLMIVGSYRSDESPTLPQVLPQAQLINLERFGVAEITELSFSMIGDAGRKPDLVSLLARETEGNALFMVEVVRALSQEVGDLTHIGHKIIPSSIFTGGIQQVLRRRLAHVPLPAQPLLKLAAVLGRQIDPNILAAAGAQNIETWLVICTDAAVLEVAQEKWRFSHDKLRETLIQDFTPEEARILHRSAAEAIQEAYPDNHDYDEVLANHWYAAGAAPEAVHYAILAAQQAIHYTALYDQAQNLLERTLGMAQENVMPPVVEARLYALLGAAAEKRGRYADATQYYERSLEAAAEDNMLHVEVLNGLTVVAWRRGDYARAEQLAQQVLSIVTDNRSGSALALSALGTVSTLQGHYEAAEQYHEQSIVLQREIGDLSGVALNLIRLGATVFRQGKFALASAYLEESLRINRQIEDRRGIATSLSNLVNVARRLGDYDAAQTYGEEALNIMREIGDSQGEAGVLLALGNLLHAGGKYESARAYYEQALAITRKIGEKSSLARTLNNLGSIAMTQKNYVTAQLYSEESLSIRREIGDPAGIALSLTNLATNAYQQKLYNAARTYGEESVSIQRQIKNQSGLVLSLLGLVPVYLHLKQRDLALETLREAIQLAHGLHNTGFILYTILIAGYYAWDIGKIETAAQWVHLVKIHAQFESWMYPMHTELVENIQSMLTIRSLLDENTIAAVAAAQERGASLTIESAMAEVMRLAALLP